MLSSLISHIAAYELEYYIKDSISCIKSKKNIIHNPEKNAIEFALWQNILFEIIVENTTYIKLFFIK